jgi:NodT family efflux transporter outer membrane factor (OMF) lipoprotein
MNVLEVCDTRGRAVSFCQGGHWPDTLKHKCERHRAIQKKWPVIAWVIAGWLLGGCAVGPDFRRPSEPAIASLTPTRLSGPTAQKFVRGLGIPQKWWEVFRCRPLNAITARAIAGNPDLEAARATVRIANANTEAARGSFFPQIGANLGGSAQKSAAAQIQATGGAVTPYSLTSGQVTVSYMLDVFGLNRRQVESLEAMAEAQQLELEAAYLTLTSRLAQAAVQEASLREQIKSIETSSGIAREVLAVLKRQLDFREASLVDVATQEAELARLEGQLEALRKQFGANRDLIIALTGRLAGEGLAEEFDFSCLKLPPDLPLSLPSSIVRRRPDVRAAEAKMHAATAEIGVAIANRLPKFDLTANAGASTSAITKLASLSSPLFFWSLAGNAALTLFDGLTNEQKQRAAEAGLDRAAALYRSAVVTAFQNVADVIHAIDADGRAFLAASRGEEAAKLNVEMTRRLLDRGQASMLQVLTAQQQLAQAALSKSQATAARLADTVLLFQALGGGWKHLDRTEG